MVKMPRLVVPDIGTELLLTQHWHFTLFNEKRNERLRQRVENDYKPKAAKFNLPKEYSNLPEWYRFREQKNKASTEWIRRRNYLLYQDAITKIRASDPTLEEKAIEYSEAMLDWENRSFDYGYRDAEDKVAVTLSSGTVLKVDRIYIRQKMAAFSSITFIIKSSPQKELKGARFWAKLEECNNIECEFNIKTLPAQKLALGR
jgi:hypothetical protein